MSYWRTLFDRSRKPSKPYYPVSPVEPPATTTTTTVTVSQAPPSIVLGTLSFSATSFTVGTSSSGSINGATALSTITGSLPAGLTINGAARTWAWDGTGTASTGSFTLTETLAGASNTPHSSTISYTINAAATGRATPTLSIQSATGAAPLVFQWSDTDSVAGLYLQLQIDQTSSAFANITQNIVAVIDASNVATLNESIGLATPAGQYWARIRTARDNDSGSTTVTGNEWNGQAFNAVSFPADVSAWSNIVNDTITASTAAWTTTTGTKKNSGVTVTGSPALVMQGVAGTGAFQDEGATIAGASKSQWELALTTLATDSNRIIAFGRYNTTTDLSVPSAEPGVSDANGYAVQVAPGSTTLDIFFNNAATLITTVTMGTVVALSDVFTDELDISGAPGTHVLKVYRNGTLVATASGKTLTGFSTAWAGIKSNEKLTANFGGSTFTHALNAGFVIYG